jgi:hypothetical protein
MPLYGIVLFPDKKTDALVREYATRAARNDIDFTAGARVHLSLLHIRMPKHQVQEVAHWLQQFSRTAQIPIHCHEVLRNKNGWYFVEVEKSQALLHLQEQALSNARLRSSGTPFTWRDSATPAQLAAYEKYGYANVGEAWSPHFTFARTPGRARTVRSPIAHEGHIDSVGLVRLGEHSTAQNICCLRRLKKS